MYTKTKVMKRYFTFAIAALFFTASCKKEKHDPQLPDEKPSPKEVIGDVSKELSKVDNITAFSEAFADLELTEEEVAEGITVFAPLDEDTEGEEARQEVPDRAVETAVGELPRKTEETGDSGPVVKDHVVRGLVTFEDLTDGKILVALSGKQLKIKRAGDQVWINGVALSGGAAASGDHQIVFVVEANLSLTETTDDPEPEQPGPATLSITVWDATGWEPAKPNGVPAANADVTLYRSQEDYANSIYAYEAEAGPDGKVVFEDIEPGVYYIEAGLDYKYNIFAQSEEPEGGVYMGIVAVGIFNSQGAIDEAPQQGGAAMGNFQWLDANGDGTISDADRTAVPYESAEVAEGETTEINVFVGYVNNLKYKDLTVGEIGTRLQQAEKNTGNWQQMFMGPLDALLSDDVSELPAQVAGMFQGIDNFMFTPVTPVFQLAWNNAYGIISELNWLEWQAQEAQADPSVLGRIKGLRAYVYLQLATYFGNAPIDEGIMAEEQDYSFVPREALLSYISTELEQAGALLPQKAADAGQLDAVSILMLKAKLAAQQGDWGKIKDYTAQVIASTRYNLGASPTAHYEGGSEVIWNISAGLPPVLADNFYAGRTVCPVFRITEAYLMNAEANIALGETGPAYEALNLLRARAGQPSLGSQASTEGLRNALYSQWATEMPKEGSRFANLVRWGLAESVLGGNGYMSHHRLLPIPQAFADQHPGMPQNSGY